MKHRIKIILLTLILLSLPYSIASAKWAYQFVVYQKNIYVISEQKIGAEFIGAKLGHVTKYSGTEGTYSGNFSNTYPKGTEYYQMKEVDVKEAIAIKEKDGTFTVANYEDKYNGARISTQTLVLYSCGAILLLLLIWYLVKKKNSKHS